MAQLIFDLIILIFEYLVVSKPEKRRGRPFVTLEKSVIRFSMIHLHSFIQLINLTFDLNTLSSEIRMARVIGEEETEPADL